MSNTTIAGSPLVLAADLSPVTVTNLKPGNILTQQSIDAGVQARIIFPANMQDGDEIAFFWGNNDLQKFYEPGLIVWTINIKTAFLPSQALSDGDYNVYYIIYDVFGNERQSPTLTVTVQGSNATVPTLLSPDVLYAGAPVNIINIARASGVAVRIPAQVTIAEDDQYKIYLRVANRTTGALISLNQVASGSIEDAAVPTTANIPQSSFDNLDGVTGNFYYEIIKPGNIQAYSRSTAVWIDTVAPGS